LSKSYFLTCETTFIQYGKGYVEGWVSKDVCVVDKEIKRPSKLFKFLDVGNAQDLVTLKGDGMVGLAAGPIGKTDHSMLVPYLFESEQIPFAVF